ncbi:hypothetical protein GCM10023216_09290 [Isoptericola chiayiensis]|uniref:Uncharacterized protein n=1 Tax=Isoptericola chiayiensis TaxID=579446 RepID=A0ABP8Y6S6_9MICO|nr:hypothetical protein [Isoptericola chiayiensis]NOW02415.1 hypothetical protein [Isoptericola chiayiensis]
MDRTDWIEHRRPDDRERIGWIRPDGDAWVAVSLLGAPLTGPVDWLEAEEALDATSLAWLGEVWILEDEDGEMLRVRLVDVSPGGVVVQTDDFGAIDAPVRRIDLPWPAPPTLRPWRPGDPDGRTMFGA